MSGLERNSYTAAVFSVTILVVMGYLTFTAVQGENGLIRLLQIEANEEQLGAEVAQLAQQRAVIENRVKRLSGVQFDIDLLDEQARAVLHVVGANEVILP